MYLGPRVEVALGETVVLRRPGGVEAEVPRHPSQRQHEHDPKHLHQRRLVHQLADVFLSRRRLAACRPRRRAEHLVVRARARVVVVPGVGDTPGVVRYEESGVAHQPNKVVDRLRFGERLVATFVREHPHPRHLGALNEPVDWPQNVPSPGGDGAPADKGGQIAERGHQHEVGGKVVRGSGQVSLETMAGDGLLDVGKLERRSSQRERFRRLVAVRDALFVETCKDSTAVAQQ